MPAVSLGVYVHIPVCNHLCGYCDFYSVRREKVPENFWVRYFGRLVEEFRYKVEKADPSWILNSIYFGGGTPSLAPAWFFRDLIQFLRQNLRTARYIEISMEANPETIGMQMLEELAGAGVNRLSMGIQSLNDGILKALGRNAGADASRDALETVAAGPIRNWNADLIYGIPGQSLEILSKDVSEILSYNPRHISAYALTLDSGQLEGAGSISDKRQHFHQEYLWKELPARGYPQYEVSNFASKKWECLHNKTVWKYRPYISLGTSGHSFFGGRRTRTIADFQRYLEEPFEKTIVSDTAKPVPDLLITSVRLAGYQGFSLFRKQFSPASFGIWKNSLEKFAARGWMLLYKNGFVMAQKGLNYSNLILEELYSDLQLSAESGSDGKIQKGI